MMNKIFVFGGLAIIAILFVENIVTGYQAYVFMDTGSTTGILVLVSSLFGGLVGFNLALMFRKDNGDDENYDF